MPQSELAPTEMNGSSPAPDSRGVDWLTISAYAGVCLLLVGVGFLLDDSIEKLVRLNSRPLAEKFAWFMSKSGEGWVIAAVALPVSAWLFWRRSVEASRLVFTAACTGLLTGAAATVVRSLLGRTRPTAQAIQGFYGVWHDSHWIIGKYEFGSFPSGHTATVVGLAAAAWMINRRWGWVAIVYAVLVAWSRIAMGCHHFSDVIAASLLGIFGAQWVLKHLGPRLELATRKLDAAWLRRKT